MKNLSFEQMEKVQGGLNLAAFACGLGIVACVCGGFVAFGEATVGACAYAYETT